MDLSEEATPHFSRTHLIQDAVTETQFQRLKRLVAAIPHEGTDHCSKENTGWWPVDPDLDAHEQKTRSLVESVARELLAYTEKPYREQSRLGVRTVSPVIVGAEWWVRLTHCDEKHEWHFDKSEDLWEETGLYRHPYYSSVLYTDDVGGETVVIDQRIITKPRVGEKVTDPATGIVTTTEEIVELDPPIDDTESAANLRVKPARNQLLVFPGWARHGVLPTDDTGARRTVLFNWWCWRPPGMPDDPLYLPGEYRGQEEAL